MTQMQIQGINEPNDLFLNNFDLNDVENNFRQAMQTMPHSAEMFVGMARVHMLKGAPNKARVFAKKAAKMKDNRGDAEGILGACALQEGRVAEALSLLSEANRQFPQHPMILTNLTKSLIQSGRYEEAKEIALKARTYGGCVEEVELDLGRICSGLHQFEEAVQHYVAAIEANPYFLPAYLRLCQFANLLGILDLSITLMEEAIGLMPHVDVLRLELHNLYLLKQNPEAAMIQAQEVAARRGWSEDHVRIGNTALLLGDLEEARQAYETALEVDSEDWMAALNLGHWHRLHQQSEPALAYYTRVAKLHPSLYKPYLGIGLLCMEVEGNLEKARACLLQASKMGPDAYEVLIHLALCDLEMGLFEEAKMVAEDALLLASDAREKERAQEVLDAVATSESA